jgi:hypothetical protein
MPEARKGGNKNALVVGAVVLALAVAALVAVLMKKPDSQGPAPARVTESAAGGKSTRVPVEDQEQPLIEFGSKDKSAQDLMAERKAEYGMKEGVDIIARSDEKVKIGERVISMQEIADQIQLENGKIVEKDIAGGPTRPVQTFGIYVVQPGDNIWNIHFRFLRDYFENRGVRLSPLADEPDERGYSSGVGKLLKFSENLVYIYNIQEKSFTEDLNLIYPMSKIVIYNMDKVYALLDSIDTSQIDEIQFDGENLWIPAS